MSALSSDLVVLVLDDNSNDNLCGLVCGYLARDTLTPLKAKPTMSAL
jgi:hypothetical protein